MIKTPYHHVNPKKRVLPPASTRPCYNCNKKTTWHYDKVIGHSRCTECGLASLRGDTVFGFQDVKTICKACGSEKTISGFKYKNIYKGCLTMLRCQKCGAAKIEHQGGTENEQGPI